MISDNYWKLELRWITYALRIWRKVPYVSNFEYLQHQVNKYILYSAVVIRKIIEDEKWAKKSLESDGIPMPKFPVMDSKVKVYEYPFVGDKDWIGHRVIVDNYDLDNCNKKPIRLEYVCNNIIHSYLWSLVFFGEKEKVMGFATSSDRYKDKYMYLVPVNEWLKALEFCVENANV